MMSPDLTAGRNSEHCGLPAGQQGSTGSLHLYFRVPFGIKKYRRTSLDIAEPYCRKGLVTLWFALRAAGIRWIPVFRFSSPFRCKK